MNVSQLISLLAARGHEPHRVSGKREVNLNCLSCEDSRRRLYITTETGAFFCFNCGVKGSLYDLLLLLGLDEFTALQLRRRLRANEDDGEEALISLRPAFITPDQKRTVQPPYGMMLLAPEWKTPLARPFRSYLEGRGVTYEQVVQFKMGMVLTGYCQGRVVIPVVTEGEVKTWVARAIYPDLEPKVLNAPDSRASEALFNIDNLEPPVVVLVEGIFDALRLPDLACATLGARLSDSQRRLLVRLGFTDIYLLRDPDEAGEEAATKEALELVAVGRQVYIAWLPEGRDPGSCSLEVIHEALRTAEPVTNTVSTTLLKRQEES